MTDPQNRPADKLIASLQERAKELNCLYEAEQILARLDPTDYELRVQEALAGLAQAEAASRNVS